MNKRNSPAVLLVAAFAVVSSLYLNSLIASTTEPAALADRLANLSAERYRNHVNVLAGPEMKGRGDGSPELEQAAVYIASQFRAFGLKPAGDGDTYFQRFELTTGSEFGPRNTITLGDRTLKLRESFVPLNFSTTAEVEGPMVFAGYGITAPEMHFDEYRGIDARDKIVVVFRHEPQELDPKSPFNGTNLDRKSVV